MKASKRPLNPQQLKFVQEYIILGNATEAARRASYAEKWADRIGPGLVGDCRVLAEINRQVTKTLSHHEVTKQRILTELARVAFSNMDDVAEWTASGIKLKDSKEIGKDKKAAVKDLIQKTGSTNEIKIGLHDKLRALEILAKFLGLDKGLGLAADEDKNVIRLAYSLHK